MRRAIPKTHTSLNVNGEMLHIVSSTSSGCDAHWSGSTGNAARTSSTTTSQFRRHFDTGASDLRILRRLHA
jgi:hypothetical protein